MSHSPSKQSEVPRTPRKDHVSHLLTRETRSASPTQDSDMTPTPRKDNSEPNEKVIAEAIEKLKTDWKSQHGSSPTKKSSLPVPETTNLAETENKKLYKTIFSLLLTLLVVFVAMFWHRESAIDLVGQYPEIWKPATLMKKSSWQDGYNLTRSSLKLLSGQYPNQGDDFWIHLHAAISSTLSEDLPKQPSAVVFLIPSDVRPSFASCLAHKIGKEVHSIFESIDSEKKYARSIMTINPKNFTDGSTITTIHERLLKYLKNGKTVIVQDVHKISREPDLMVFHAFCDNSAAPDTRATFFFLLPLPADYEVTGMNSVDEMTSEILHTSWTNLSPNKRPALIARVAVHNIMVRPGDRCDL